MTSSPFASRRALLASAAVAPALLGGCAQLSRLVPAATPPAAAPTKATFAFASGAQMFVLNRGPVTIHAFVAPESGLFASSYVIEFKDQLWVYDTQLTPALGRELRFYANTLNKKFTRVILSHEHVDSWSGWAEFADVPTFAPRETEAFMTDVAPKMAARPGVQVPKIAGAVGAGNEIVSGVRIEWRIVRDAESIALATLGFPDQSTFIAGDLIYERVHAFFGHRQVARWGVALDQLPAWTRTDTLILPGHGVPTTSTSIAVMKRYLQAAQDAFGRFKTAAEIEQSLRQQFPDYVGNYYLRFGLDIALKR